MKILSKVYSKTALARIISRDLLGHELVVNGDASDTSSTDSSVAPLAGWANFGTHNVSNKVTIGNGEFNLISDGTSIGIRQVTGLVVGIKYQLNVSVSSITGIAQIRDFSLVTTFHTLTLGQNSTIFTATDTGISVARGAGPCDVTFDNISIKEVL